MTDYKKKRIFDAHSSSTLSSLQEEDSVDQQKLKTTDIFHEEFIPMSSEQLHQAITSENDDELVAVIRPKKTKGKWIGAILTVFLGLLGWQAMDNLIQAYQSADWLTLGWSGFIALLASLGIKATVKELWKLRRLRHQIHAQEQAEDFIHSHQQGRAGPFCQTLAKQAGITSEHVGYARWLQSINDNHNDADVMALYDDMVVALQDEKAKKLIANYACESAVLVAMSPLAIADLLLVAWRNFKMLEALSQVYGVELGYWSRIRLLQLVLVNMAFAGISELAIDLGMNVLSLNLAKTISTHAAQGIGIGILTGRLGLKAIALLRPLPWQKNKAIKLSEIRKLVVQRIVGKG